MRIKLSKSFGFATVALLLLAPTVIAAEKAENAEPVVALPEGFVVDFAEVQETEAVEGECEQCAACSREFTAGPDVVEAGLAEGQRCVKMPLFKIKNWPEFKVEMKTQCRRVFGHKVCIDVPQAFQRNCELTAYAEICHPDATSMRNAVLDCTRQAVAAGVVAGIYTGNLEAASAALKAYLAGCLATKGMEHLERLSVKVRSETKCGRWKPR